MVATSGPDLNPCPLGTLPGNPQRGIKLLEGGTQDSLWGGGGQMEAETLQDLGLGSYLLWMWSWAAGGGETGGLG